MQIPASFQAAWGAREQPTKGPKPSLSLERIVEAGITVADRDGLDGVSMAKVAAELGSAPMSLYRYVSTKEELLLLMVDGALGDPPQAITEEADWRAGLLAWASEVYHRYLARPWAVRVPISGPPLTPHNILWLEAALAVLAGTPLEASEKLSTVLVVSGYARSQALLISEMMQGGPTHLTGEDPALGYWELLRMLAPVERFPHLHAVLEVEVIEEAARAVATGVRTAQGYRSEDAVVALDDEVRFGFDRILDGIEALIRSRTST